MSLPTTLGRLRQVRRIGAGGFATVWLYHDDELDSPVAVKALADNWAARTDIRDRFLDEARILRRADSDHVVRVYDIGETDRGTPYFVMSYADRGTVANLLDGDLPALSDVVTVVEQAAMGLEVLHGNGVIHRDIKPQNLLLRTNGETTRLMVADLGMAKAMLNASGLTQVVGTPAYMAPEQATGIGLSSRADIYGLGAVAYRLLTGQVVREGPLGSMVHVETPTPPSQLVDIPVGLDAVVLRALAADPDARWPDATSFARAFSMASDSPIDATRPRIKPISGEPTIPPGNPPTIPPAAAAPVPSGSASPPVSPEGSPSGSQPRPAGHPGAQLLAAGEAQLGEAPAAVQPEPAERAGMRPLVLVLWAILVLAVTFGAAFLITQQVR